MRPNDPSAVDSAAIIPFDPTIQNKSHKEVSDEVMGDKLLELMDLTEGLGIKTLRVW